MVEALKVTVAVGVWVEVAMDTAAVARATREVVAMGTVAMVAAVLAVVVAEVEALGVAEMVGEEQAAAEPVGAATEVGVTDQGSTAAAVMMAAL